MAPHSSTLAWQIPWTEEPGRLQSMGSRRVGHDWMTSLSLFTFMHWRRKWQPTPVFLPENPRDGGAWWAAIYGVAQSGTRLMWFSHLAKRLNALGTKKGCLPSPVLLNKMPGLVAHTIRQEKEVKGIHIRKKCFVHWTYQCQHHGCDIVLKFYKMLPLGQGTTRLVQHWERSTSRLYAVTLLI